MRAYLAYVRAGYRRWSTYRLAAAAGAFTNTVFGLVKAAIAMAAVGAAGGVIVGYDARQIATYAWISQALIAPVLIFGWDDLAQRVRTGDIAIDLARPVDLQLSWLAADLGRAAFVALPRGLPPLAVGAMTTGLALPGAYLPYLLGALSVVVAVALSFSCCFIVNLTAFWLLDVRGPLSLYNITNIVFCGLIVPVHWFPDWMLLIARATPFPSLLQTPVDVLTARSTGVDAAAIIGVQAAWLVAVLLLGRVVLAAATRRLVVQVASTPAGALRPYRILIGSRVRSQTSYRSSFALDVLSSIGVGLLELAELYVIFHNVDALGGLDFHGALLVFALANTCFSLAEIAVGHVDSLPVYVREGTLDAFLLRPLPVLAQLISSDVSLRRLGRTSVALVCLAVALPATVPQWSPLTVLLLVSSIISGTAIFAAVFIGAAAAQFWLMEGREFANAFTYGGSYAASYPASVLHLSLRVFYTFVIPAAFTAYLPALALLGEPGPPWLPAWLGWYSPLAGVAAWTFALLGWREGVRHYTGAGG